MAALGLGLPAEVTSTFLLAVLAAAAALWWLRRPVSLLPPIGGAAPVGTRHAVEERDRIEQLNLWLPWVRWIVVFGAAALVLFFESRGAVLPAGGAWRLLVVLASLGALNIVLSIAPAARGVRLLLLQFLADLVAFTAVLHLTGGVENPLSALMGLHVILGGIVLARRQCYLVALGAWSLYAGLALAEWSGLARHYRVPLFHHGPGGIEHVTEQGAFAASKVLMQGAVLLATAFIVTTVVERLHDYEERLDRMVETAVTGRRILEQALTATGAGICVLERRGDELRIETCNPRWSELMHAGAEPAAVRLPPGAVTLTRRAWEGAASDDVLVLAAAGGGPPRSIQVAAAPLEPEHGQVVRVVLLAQDVTESRRTQEQLVQAGRMAAVGELVANVAHEVNNPNGIISAKARLLLSDRRGEMSPKVAEELGKVIDLSDRIARIVAGLLSYAHPSTSRREAVEPAALIEAAVGLVQDRARTGGVRIDVTRTIGGPRVFGNAHDLQQVLLNLLLNAFDAMPRGGRLGVVVDPVLVDLPSGRRGVAIHVEDSGVGISPDLRPRIFEPFVSTKAVGQGTGLGLAICQGVIRSHGGTIDVVSEPGSGSRFTVCLPLAAELAAVAS